MIETPLPGWVLYGIPCALVVAVLAVFILGLGRAAGKEARRDAAVDAELEAMLNATLAHGEDDGDGGKWRAT